MRADESDADIIARLQIALRRMPKLSREIFLAIRLDEMTCIEISSRTGLSVRQVERQFAKGLRQLVEARRSRVQASQRRRRYQRIARN